MQRDRFVAADIWLANAHVDLQVAAELVVRFPSRACFHAQQAAELVLKAALIALTDDHPRAYTGGVLIGEIEIEALGRDVPVDIAAVANRLDLFYMGSRYPDALGGAGPSKVLQKSDAMLAIEQARGVFAFATDLISQLKVDNAIRGIAVPFYSQTYASGGAKAWLTTQKLAAGFFRCAPVACGR